LFMYLETLILVAGHYNPGERAKRRAAGPYLRLVAPR
jgi:hypothetical protein